MTRNVASVLAFAAVSISAVVAATLMAGSARADDITIDSKPFVSSRSRAEVRAELMRNNTSDWATQYELRRQNGYRRGQTPTEYDEANRNSNVFNGEDSGSMYLGNMPLGHNRGTTMGAPAR